jgi:methenyltetrahydromethanopterin cyclohydrolase
MISLNQRADAIVQQMISNGEALGLRVKRLKNGTTILDAGVEAPGSMEAGRLFACACMGGLGQVSFVQQTFDNESSHSDSSFWLPAVVVIASYPHIACMASQYAGWAIKRERYFAMGSGPARALYAGEEAYKKLDYRDQAETAVLMLEGREIPDEEMAVFVAGKCGVKTERLSLLIAPTASLVGSIQIAARSAETCMHKLRPVPAGAGGCGRPACHRTDE